MKKIWKRIGLVAVSSIFVTLFAGCKKDNFNPDENEPVCIYGPPEMFEETVSGDDVSGEENIEFFDPAINETPCIYGPPEMFENKTIDN